MLIVPHACISVKAELPEYQWIAGRCFAGFAKSFRQDYLG
jgi:hypothetical protein